jgi:methyl-accepting chemotaxis protein
LDFVSALLAKTLRSSTFKLALLFIVVFGVAIIALFGYVYSSTVSYLRSQFDHTLTAELALLQKAYDRTGRSGLIDAVAQHIRDQRLEAGAYMLVEPSLHRLAGNLADWPSTANHSSGWASFSAPESQAPLRATFVTLADGSHLLVGRAVEDIDELAQKINVAFAFSIFLIFVLAGVAGVSVTQRTVGRIESINATSRAIMQSGLGQRIPLRGTHDEWDELAANLNSMLDRIEELVESNRQVSDNVAHDLRTPLTRM